MLCRRCKSENVKIRWQWSRKSQETIGSGDSTMDFEKFVSRSARYICRDCGHSQLAYSRSYDNNEPDLPIDKRAIDIAK